MKRIETLTRNMCIAERREASGNVVLRVLLVDEQERALGTWFVLGLDDCLCKDWNRRVGRNKANLVAEDQNNTTAKSKGIWVFPIV